MDIIIYSPDAVQNEVMAQATIANFLGYKSFLEALPRVFTVSPTLENLETLQPEFYAVLADELPTHFHLVGAQLSVGEYRKKHNKPNLIAVYCTTVDPLARV